MASTALAVTVVVALAWVAGLEDPTPSPAQPAAAVCNRYASPSGSDGSGTGALGSPLASIAGLDRALEPGQTGCLLAGTYGSYPPPTG